MDYAKGQRSCEREEAGVVDLSEQAQSQSEGSSVGASTSAENPWRERLLTTLRGMPPDAFERLCQTLLRRSGLVDVRITGGPRDGGIDGYGAIRLAGLVSIPIVFQCKRYSGNVPVSAVRDFRGAMQGRANRGLILTTGKFTQDALIEAARDGAQTIDLIDGDLLVDKLKEFRLGINVEMVESVDVDADWFKAI